MLITIITSSVFMAMAEGPANPASTPDGSYSYARILTKENTESLPMEPVPDVKLEDNFVKPGDCYFISGLNLSHFKKPVLREWSYGEYSSFPNYGYTIVAYGNRYFGITSSLGATMKALPAADNLRLGKNIRIDGYKILTIGEMPANKDIIILNDMKMQIVKGTDTGSGIQPVVREDGLKEAEVRYTVDGMSALDQGVFSVAMDHRITATRDLTDMGAEGAYVCTVMTTSGEIEPLCIGYSESYGRKAFCHFLLPQNSSEIILRWLIPEHYEEPISTGEDFHDFTSFITDVSQPGYETEPELWFTVEELTGDYEDFQAADILKTPRGFNLLTTYDVNKDGSIEWIARSNNDYNVFDLFAFTPDFLSTSVMAVKFGNALGFTPYVGTTLGYDSKSIFSVDENGTRKELYKPANARFALVDFDSNGMTDFINLEDNSVISFNAAGEPVVQNLKTMTMDDYLGIIPPGDNPLGSGMSVIRDPHAPPAVFASYIQTDINGDGYPDFVDAASGNYYMNLGDGRFVTDTFGGKLLFRDFDGDGINDFLFYNSTDKSVSVTLQRIGSDAVTKKLLTGYACSDDIWMRDFDRDGDVDILIPFNAKDNDGMAFLVMFENNGSGTFKKKEYMIDGAVNFRKCIDWNADGNYEILTDMAIDKENYNTIAGKIASYTVDGLSVNTTPEYIFSDLLGVSKTESSHELLDVVDLNNSGIHRFMFDTFMLTPAATPNTRPTAPAMELSFDDESGELTVTWQRGNDRETAPADLTYELKIGTTPGGDDLMCAAATPDGKRRHPLAGNCGYDLKRKFNTAGWPQGDIYISIQAVDDSGLGSEFSEPVIFSNTQLPAQFIIEAPINVAVYEDIVLKAVSDVSGLEVTWTPEGGEVIAASAGEATVRFTTPGIKTVTMTVADGTGKTKSANLTVEIYPIRMESPDGNPGVDLALDLDLDGYAEVHDDNTSKFFEGDASGNYTQISRLFNTRTYYAPVSADINRDGLPDVIYSEGHLINEGDKSMGDQTPDNFINYTYFPDLDNDGLLDALREYQLFKNGGAYADFIPVDNDTFDANKFGEYTRFFDVNHDGLVDIVCLNTQYLNSDPAYYENVGNFRFVKHELPRDTGDNEFSYVNIGDFDGNGKADYLCIYYYTGAYFILWDNGEQTEIGAFEKYPREQLENHNFDFDNNGCMDLLVNYRNTSTGESATTVVLFNADHTFTTVEADGTWLYHEIPYTRTDGRPGLRDNVIMCAPNEKPTAPTGVKTSVENNRLIISWDAATDKETPSASLRYNLSVKRVGADGDDAYIISPMNGGINDVPLPSDARLIDATRFPIPLLAMPKGDYEIKVQAVDGRHTPGDFSTPITVSVEAAGYDAPAETMVGETVAITFNADVNISEVNFGPDAVIESTVGQTVYLRWITDGVKTVTAPGIEFTVTVHPALDASFSLPETIAGGALVYLPADAAYEHTWKLSGYRPSFVMWEYFGEPAVERIDDNTVAIRFNYRSGYSKMRLTHTVTAPYGSTTFEAETSQVTFEYKPQIGIVDIDDATGKYCVQSLALDEDVTSYMVYRETETYNEYELIGTMSGNDTFIDTESSPMEHTSRYMLKARFTYGESLAGTPHQPIHAIISKGINGEWNVSWNKYEGRDAATYRILRGDSPSSLECIAEVSGNTTSYSDHNPTPSTRYYAVETLIAQPSAAPAKASAVAPKAAPAGYWRSRSNLVSTGVSSLDDLNFDSDTTVDVYNLLGVCLKRNATLSEIRSLAPGLYIIGGHKVAIR